MMSLNETLLDLAPFALAGAAPAVEFTILIHETGEEHALRASSGPGADAYWADYGACAGAMAQVGVIRGGAPLKAPGDAMGAPLPVGLMLGGWMLIDVADIDTARKWAARSPAPTRTARGWRMRRCGWAASPRASRPLMPMRRACWR